MDGSMYNVIAHQLVHFSVVSNSDERVRLSDQIPQQHDTINLLLQVWLASQTSDLLLNVILK